MCVLNKVYGFRCPGCGGFVDVPYCIGDFYCMHCGVKLGLKAVLVTDEDDL